MRIEARDQHQNIAITEQQPATLVVDGSATGAGVVTIVDGVGTILLENTVPEIVTLSLEANPSRPTIDLSATQDLKFFSGNPTSCPTA